jgi:hypothetical protein
MVAKRSKSSKIIPKLERSSPSHELHKDWEKRLEWAEKQISRHLEDLNKANDYIIERAFKFLTALNIFSLIILNTFKEVVPTWVVIAFVLAFVVTVIFFMKLYKTSNIQSTGFSASIIKLKENGEYLDLDPETNLIHKDNDAQAIYAWLIKQLKDREKESTKLNENLAKTYNRAVQTTCWIIGLAIAGWITVELVRFFFADGWSAWLFRSGWTLFCLILELFDRYTISMV